MKLLAALLLLLGMLAGNHSTASSVAKEKRAKAVQTDECPDDLCLIYGRIQFVEHFPDCKVKVVEHFEDMRVQVVEHFPDDVAKWQIVEHFPDYKIQIVEHFPDFTIRYVEHFPGVDGD